MSRSGGRDGGSVAPHDRRDAGRRDADRGPDDDDGVPARRAGTTTVTVAGPAVVAGNDLPGSLTVVRGELGDPHLPTLPLLPDRGPGADGVGRTAALLVDLPVEVGPHGWRIASRPGEDLRHARSVLASDVNVLADLAGAEQGPATRIGVGVLGPLSLASLVDLAGGEKILADHGARRDLAASLGAGLAAHLDALRVALPGAHVTVRIDEPKLTAVLDGTVPTASGYRTVRAVDRAEVRQLLRETVQAAHAAGATDIVLAMEEAPLPLTLARESDADGIMVAVGALRTAPDLMGEHLDGGGHVTVGLDTNASGGREREVSDLVAQVLDPWHRLGLPEARLPQLTLAARTPVGGLTGTAAPAGATGPGRLPGVLRRLVATADALETTARDA